MQGDMCKLEIIFMQNQAKAEGIWLRGPSVSKPTQLLFVYPATALLAYTLRVNCDIQLTSIEVINTPVALVEVHSTRERMEMAAVYLNSAGAKIGLSEFPYSAMFVGTLPYWLASG